MFNTYYAFVEILYFFCGFYRSGIFNILIVLMNNSLTGPLTLLREWEVHQFP